MKNVFISAIAVNVVISLMAIFGWLSDNLLLASFGVSYIPMAPLSAACFIVASAALFVHYFFQLHRMALIATAGLLSIVAIDILAVLAALPTFHFERLILQSPDAFGAVSLGRMSPITAAGVLLIAGSLTAMGTRYKSKGLLIGIMATSLYLMATTVLVGYGFNTPLLYGMEVIPVALTTDICFLLVAIAIFAANGKEHFPLSLLLGNQTHALLLRFFLPITVLIIIVQGVFQVYLSNSFFTNEALTVSLFILLALLVVTLVTIYIARLISTRIDNVEAEKKRLISTIEATSDIVGISDAQGVPLYLNKVAMDTFGLSENSNLRELHTSNFYPEWAYHIIMSEGLPIANRDGQWEGETAIISRSGEEIPVSQVILYHHDPSGSDGYYSTVIRDISRLKAHQQEIENVNKKLQTSNADLQQFAYSASHDLNEPLRMITSFMELLKKKYGPDLDEKANEYVGYALDGGYRMKQLIADLLDFSQAGNSANASKERINLNDILAEAKMNLLRQVEENAAEIIIERPLPEVTALPSAMTSLLQNLISNAIKFRKKDQPPVIRIAWTEDATNYIISVSDNGIGIAPENYDKVFDVFKRLHRREEYPGTGMGLAICRKITEHHGGKIWVESKFGEGSTFYVSLSKI